MARISGERSFERTLPKNQAFGVVRHADARYEEAIECAREMGLKLPSLA